jgi:tricorn protease-like protein
MMGFFGSKILKIKERLSLGSLPGGVSLLSMAKNVIAATAKDDKKIRIWNVKGAVELKQIKKNKEEITALAVSSDESRFATASKKTVDIWDLKDLKIIKTITAKDSIHALAFHPDGSRIALGMANYTISLFDLNTDKTERPLKLTSKIIKKIFEEPPKEITTISFSPDGRFMAGVGQNGIVIVWKLEEDKTVNVLLTPPHKYFSVTFSQDNRYMLATGGYLSMRIGFTSGGPADIQIKEMGGGLIVYNLNAESTNTLSSMKFICERATLSSDGKKILVLASSLPFQNGLKKTVNAYDIEDILAEKSVILDKPKARVVLGRGVLDCSAVFGLEEDTLAISLNQGLQFVRLEVT